MNGRSMALIQRLSTRISIVHGMGVYDVKSAMVFGMPGVSLANTAAIIME
jgi:hypothetical protein